MSPPSPPIIRVLVVDDSAFARKVVREVLSADPRFEVVGIARDGLDALEKIAELRPDVITLDLVMPHLDGVGLLRALPGLALSPTPRVVVVSMADEDSELAVTALQNGAFELIHKPTALATDRLFELSTELTTKVAAAAVATSRKTPAAIERVVSPRPPIVTHRRLVVIGTSTGGPHALTSLLGQMPADFPVPIAIALHIPAGYTEALARRLDGLCALEVVEAYEGIAFTPGRVVLARAGMHLKIAPGDPPHGKLDIFPLIKPHRPSVDVLFETAADALGEACVGVVLTGMGDDGLLGARALRAAGSVVLTEAESSCVVYGMPRSVREAGLSNGESELAHMAKAILKQL